jgi:hypothetical protein
LHCFVVLLAGSCSLHFRVRNSCGVVVVVVFVVVVLVVVNVVVVVVVVVVIVVYSGHSNLEIVSPTVLHMRINIYILW